MKDFISFLYEVDDSHQMTTAKKHLQVLGLLAIGADRILELGSHRGVSTAAMAIADGGRSKIVSVDLCDTVSKDERASYWAGFSLTSIDQIQADAGMFLRGCQSKAFDLVFHDAAHGDAVVDEYIECARVGRIVAIHDFERLTMPWTVVSAYRQIYCEPDDRGRVLFVGASQ